MGKIDDIAAAYGTQTIITPFTPVIEDYLRTTVRCGLGWDAAWFYAIVQTKKGKRYGLTRGYEKASSSNFMSCNMLDDPSEISPRLFKRMYVGFCFHEKVKDKDMVIAQSAPSKHHFKVVIEPQRFHWQEENGEVDLHLTALGPAMRLFSPGGKINEETYYTSELCAVTGTVMGEEVSGFGGMDQAWLPHGIAWTQCKTYLYHESYWLVFANRYEDETTDYGIVGCGPGGWNLSYYVQNGVPVTSHDNEFRNTYAEAGYPSELDIRLGANHFKWTADCRLNEIKGHVQWMSGRMINLGEKKVPIASYSQFEYRPFGQFQQ
ncbi:MAG TPA: hypothetical protein PLB81_08340 [Deltaproteobacteria bacterium]|nr:hypothetical protein [Deltaproteobacteria bacterium]